jgi:peptide/nickel transport system substrate-binding protein
MLAGKKSSWRLCVALVVIVVLACGFGVAAADPLKLFVSLTREPLTSCDPAVVVDGTSEQLHGTAFEGLLKYKDGASTLDAALATGYEVSADGLTYTFSLREGVKFHDGTDFTSDSVKYNFERVKAMNLGVATYLAGFDRAEVEGAYKVKLILKTPNASFPYGIPWIKIVSPTAVRAHEKDGDWAQAWLYDHMVGTGPYMLDHWDRATELVLVRFPEYWGGWEGKHLQGLVFKVVAEPATQRMLLETGDADMIDQVLVADISAIKANPDLVYNEAEVLGIQQIMMNTKQGPLADINIRKAMSYAWDYDLMISQVMGGRAHPAQGPLPSAFPEQDKTLPVYHKDLEKAGEFLAAAGYANGGFTLKLAVVQRLMWEIQGGQMFQADLATLGIKLEIQELAWATMLSACKDPAGGFDMSFLSIGARIADPNLVFARGWHTGGVYDWSHFTSAELNAVLDAAVGTVNPEVRKALYVVAQRMIVDGCAAVWVMTSSQQNATRAWVHGYKMSPVDEFLTNFYTMWIE